MLKIGDQMIKYPYYTTATMGLEEALEYMHDCDIRHLPVVDDEGIVGLISERDLLSFRGLNKADLLTVGDLMAPRPYAVSADANLAEVVETMAKEKYGSVLIVDGGRQLIGIFTATDALYLLAQMLKEDRPARIHKPLDLVQFSQGFAVQ